MNELVKTENQVEEVKIVNPQLAAKSTTTTSMIALKAIMDSDIYKTRSPFEGLGRYVTTEDIENTPLRMFNCSIADFDAEGDDGEVQHYHYSYWLGVVEATGEPFIYGAGKQLTDIAELFLNGQNEDVMKDMQKNGIRCMLNKIGLKKNKAHTFTKVTLLP